MSAALPIEALKCRCGLNMIMSRKVPGCGRCTNCDGLQPQQLQIDPETGDPFPRIATPWDKRYQATILHLMKTEWYPEQKFSSDEEAA